MSIPITNKYLLYKPGLGNEADIRVLNHNTDNIDNGMYQNRRMIGDTYNPESTAEHPYMKGDLVVKQTTILDENDNPVSYSFQYCKCLQDNTYGPWDPTKWESTDVATELKLGGGGASSLADLTDTDIDSPANGEVLTYDGENWVNVEGSASVTKTATGNPIEISDGASAPIVKCVTQITGSQDLHGYDKPWVGGAGKNLLNPSTMFGGLASYYTVNADESVSILRSDDRAWGYVAELPLKAGTYTVSQTGGSYNSDIRLSTESFNVGHVFTSSYTFTLASDGSVKMKCGYGGESYPVTYKMQIEAGSQPTAWTPYSNICPITAYTEGEIEVRGKNLFDKNASDLETDKALTNNGTTSTYSGCDVSGYIKVDAGQSYTYYGSAMTSANIAFAYYDKNKTFISPIDVKTGGANAKVVTIPSGASYVRFEVLAVAIDTIQFENGTEATTYEPYTSTTHTTTYPSAIYRGSEDVVNGEVTSDMHVIDLGDLTWTKHFFSDNNIYYTNTMNYIVTPPDNYTVGNIVCDSYMKEAWESLFSNNVFGIAVSNNGRIAIANPNIDNLTDFNTHIANMKASYQLKTPTTTTVTPTNLPIKSLSGYTHIESSTGDMEVEYITGEFQPLVDLIHSSKHVYSTAEQIVGTWIDGKTVYEKTVVNEMALSQTWTNYMDASDIDTIISVEERCERDGEDVPAPFSFNEVASWIRRDNYIKVCITSNSSDWKILSLTIRYTKATTQTRSLSLSKGEISGEKKKADEEPIEKETDVENDLDEWLEESDEIEEEVDEGTDEDSDVEEEEENEATNE